MRKFLISLALTSAALGAVPAAAQYRQDHQGRPGWQDNGWERMRPRVEALQRELGQVEQRIQFSLQRRAISPREAYSMRREANDVRVSINRRGRNGISEREFVNLQARVDRLQARLRMERRDNDRRPY
jgi:hypothetical protein